mmetsp:Transcript_12791/g.21928  ORF Transcript_12791/g.21928 Transcript_12791/m.21928 type:complete len:226 (+) Transcript_12791:1300-1977(+)
MNIRHGNGAHHSWQRCHIRYLLQTWQHPAGPMLCRLDEFLNQRVVQWLVNKAVSIRTHIRYQPFVDLDHILIDLFHVLDQIRRLGFIFAGRRTCSSMAVQRLLLLLLGFTIAFNLHIIHVIDVYWLPFTIHPLQMLANEFLLLILLSHFVVVGSFLPYWIVVVLPLCWSLLILRLFQLFLLFLHYMFAVALFIRRHHDINKVNHSVLICQLSLSFSSTPSCIALG